MDKKRSISVEDCLSSLYSEISDTYVNDVNDIDFYRYVVSHLEHYIEQIRKIPEEELIAISDGKLPSIITPITKRRFLSIANSVSNNLISVLQEYYKGDILNACQHLNKLLLCRFNYLTESYISCFEAKIKYKKAIFYRMRDISDGVDINCNHVPFTQRSRSSFGRFSLPGIPCIYLSDSKETASAELKDLGKGKKRWYSEFYSQKDLLFYDVHIPSVADIKEMNQYDKFRSLLTYPIKLMCSKKTNRDSGMFHEEYFIPQILCFVLLVSKEEKFSYKGISYSSTLQPGGINYIIPAYYEGNEPCMDKTSEWVKETFNISAPIMYKM
jgi:hypothetical protein